MPERVAPAPADDDALLARAECRSLPLDPAEGLFPAGCWLRRVNGQPIQILGGGRALLLEVAHPIVAAGVAEHSDFRRDPFGRLRRTLTAMSAITFRDRAAALAAARGIGRAHAAVEGSLPRDVGRYRAGTRYSALDPEAMRWVWATLVDTAVVMYALFAGELSEAAADEYYADHCAIARLLGIPAAQLPSSWRAFRRYFEEMLSSDVLAVDDTAREIAESVLSAPTGGDAKIARILTTALLPPVLREAYGLRWGPEHEARFAALVRSVAGLRRARSGAPPVDADPEAR
jgi:uncharacterized protein (DUF2236 family)